MPFDPYIHADLEDYQEFERMATPVDDMPSADGPVEPEQHS